MKLSEIRDRPVRRSVEWAGEAIEFDVAVGRIDAAFIDRGNALGPADYVGLARLLADIVVWVDITDDAGEFLACTPEMFAELLPFPLMTAMWVQAGSAAQPNPPRGEISDAG